MILFDDNKMKMAEKKHKENPVGYTGEGKNKNEVQEKCQEKVRPELSWS